MVGLAILAAVAVAAPRVRLRLGNVTKASIPIYGYGLKKVCRADRGAALGKAARRVQSID